MSVARPHPIATAIGFLGTLRFHPFYPDVNAAGSYLVLFAVPVLWRALKTSWWWPAAVTVTLALWLTGSRSATVAGAFGCMCCWLMSRRTGRRGLIVGLIAAIVIAGGVFMIPSGAHTDFGSGVGIRIELAWLGLQAAASSPLLGVGLDKLKPIVGENAHNQFVQILAEMGIAGFAAFLWVLIAAAAQVRAALKRSAAVDPALAGLSGGLIAFLFSSFFGHPFLTSEVLLAFMLVLGVTVGISATR